jgi:hypothetical protein
MRNRLLGLSVGLCITGVAAAPPGDVDRPRVDGREPTPIARDYYEPEVEVRGFGSVSRFPAKSMPRLTEEMGENVAHPMYAITVGHTMGANIPSMSGNGSLPVGDFASGFRNAVLNNMTVPLGTVPIDD